MKNREKFLLIFMISTILLAILIVIKGTIEFNDLSNEQKTFFEEIEIGEKLGQYSLEIEEGIKEHMTGEVNQSNREEALDSYVSSVNTEYLLEYRDINARLVEIINLIFYSISITLFIYCMLTIEYKNVKQYILANLGIIGMFIVLAVFNYAFGLGETIIFYDDRGYNTVYLLPLLYIVFLIGNVIKNRRNFKI